MAFTTLAQVLAALPGQRFDFQKADAAATTFGQFASLWGGAGFPPAGATPSSGLAGDVPTAATTGAFPLVTPATALSLARITAAGGGGSGSGTLLLYDRLWHNSGISATATTAQTISSVALTRPDALGAGAEAWWQVYATTSTGTPTITLTYTNSAGTASRTGTSGLLAASMNAGRTGPFQLAAGDTGVRSIQTWQADVSFAGGTVGLVVRRLIAAVPMIQNLLAPATEDILACGLRAVPGAACLELLLLPTASASGSQSGSLSLVDG